MRWMIWLRCCISIQTHTRLPKKNTKYCILKPNVHEHSFLVASIYIISSDRSSCSDDGLLYIRQRQQLVQIFTQSLDAIDVTSVTLICLNSINAIEITRYLGDIMGIYFGYLWDIFWISLGYVGDMLGISLSERTSGVPPVIFISFIDNFLIHLLVGQANALRLSIVSCDKQSDNCAWPAITLSSSRRGPSHCFKEKRFFEQAHNA